MYPIYRTLETFIYFSFKDTVVILFQKKGYCCNLIYFMGNDKLRFLRAITAQKTC